MAVTPSRPGDPESIGPYRVLGRLGEGGQGVVYLGLRDGGRERVAVKVLHAAHAQRPEIRRRFIREIEVARQVAEFCTARVLDAGEADDALYVASEYIEGVSLQKSVEADGPRTGPALHRIAVGTATALAAIHQAGIVHRDFKPGNVVLGPDGPRVIDFGISRALDAAVSQTTGGPLGTPSYMSPEQFSGAKVGPPSDVFAWAATIVFAATGHPPFGEDTIPAVLHRILTADPDLSAVPSPLRETLAACLSKSPESRPTTRSLLLTLITRPPEGESRGGEEVRSGLGGVGGREAPPVGGGASVEETRPRRGTPREAGPVVAGVASRQAGRSVAVVGVGRGDRGGGSPRGVATAGPGGEASGAAGGGRDATTPPGSASPRRRPVGLIVTTVLAAAGLAGVALLLPSWLPSDEVPRVTSTARVAGPPTTSAPPSRTPVPSTPPLDIGPAIGEPVGAPLRGHTDNVQSVAVTEVNGRKVIVSGSNDRSVRLWDFASRAPLARLTGHTDWVRGVATAELDGEPVAVSAGHDQTIRTWDIATRRPTGRPIKVSQGLFSLAVATMDGRPVAVAGGDDGRLWVYDLATRKRVGPPRDAHLGPIFDIAVAEVNGRPHAFTAGGDGVVRMWDLEGGESVVVSRQSAQLGAVTTGMVDGRLVVISGGGDQVIRVDDALTGAEVRAPIRGHNAWIYCLATVRIGDGTALVSGGNSSTARVNDLATRRLLGRPFKDHDHNVFDVTTVEQDGRVLAVTAGGEGNVRVWRIT